MGFVADRVGQTIGQVGQPQVPVQGGKGGVQQPTIPAQGGKGQDLGPYVNIDPRQSSADPRSAYIQNPQQPFGQQTSPGVSMNSRPEGYVSPYANYGFDPGFAQHLDNQYYLNRGMDGGQWNYDPTNQMFTNVGGMRAPGSGPDPTMSLANMQRTYEIQNQLRTMGPKPNANGMFTPIDMQKYARNNPEFMRLQNELYSITNPGQTMPQFPPQKPGIPPQGGKGQQTEPSPTRFPPTPTRPFNRDNELRRDPRSALQQIQETLSGQPQQPQMPQRPQVQPANPQRGLGALQTDKFRRRLG
jgi:hypothetical protein